MQWCFGDKDDLAIWCFCEKDDLVIWCIGDKDDDLVIWCFGDKDGLVIWWSHRVIWWSHRVLWWQRWWWRTHPQAPLVLYLSTEVQVHLRLVVNYLAEKLLFWTNTFINLYKHILLRNYNIRSNLGKKKSIPQSSQSLCIKWWSFLGGEHYVL